MPAALRGELRSPLPLNAGFVPSQGKGLFATRSIRKGEAVFVEKPVVSSQFLWNALYNYRGEPWCGRPGWVLWRGRVGLSAANAAASTES